MRLGVTCLLVVCSLSALGEDAKTTTTAGPEVARNPAVGNELQGKLDWNVRPAYWEALVGNHGSSDVASAAASAVISRGLFASDYDLASSVGESVSASNEAKIERVLRKTGSHEGVRFGESDYVFRSPILEGLLPRPAPDGASLGEKLLNLPIVRMVRPLPMPEPPGGGKYFKWGSRDQAWAEFSQRLPGPGAIDNGM